MKNFFSKVSALLLLSSLAFLPSCEWLKKKVGLQQNETSTTAGVTTNGEVLATMNGKPILTADEFEKQFKNLIETHPYGAVLAQMEGVERKVFDGLVSQKAITRYIEEQGINKTPEYQQQLEALIQMLNTRFFQQKHQPKVADAEMKEFYDKNKQTNLPEAVVSRGGVTASGVTFTKEADAKAFLEKAKGKGAQLEQVAKEANLSDKYRDFKMVNETSPIEPALRQKIVTYKKFPTVELVKVDDKTFYVVSATGKEESKYRPYEEVKPYIEQRLSAKKQEESLEKAVDKLKKDYNIQVDESYFAKKEAEKKADQKDVGNEEQLDMVMPEAPVSENAQSKKPTGSAKSA